MTDALDPFTAPPLVVRGHDGVPIATHRLGAGPPLVLVHGTGGDHTTWRVAAPLLAARFTLFAVDRRGRGSSGDGPPTIAAGYAIEAEYADLAAVVEAVAAATDADGVPVVGHSYGGRCGLGAALLTPRLGRLVVYEGAPAPTGMRFERPALVGELDRRLAAGDRDGLLEAFLREVVGMDDAAIEAYRANPVWPARVAAAHTIPRELAAAGVDAPERFAGVRQPVLLMAGSDSPVPFQAGSAALAGILPEGRLVTIDGARHGAHHTHADRFVDEVVAFLG